MNKEKRVLKIIFNKNGNGNLSTKIALPVPWIKILGITEEEKEVTAYFADDKIIIEKRKQNGI